jgi:hypothetical protein
MIPARVTRGSNFGSDVGARRYHVDCDIKHVVVGLYTLYSMSRYHDMRYAQARSERDVAVKTVYRESRSLLRLLLA